MDGVAQGGGAGGQGTFLSTPSTVPQRLGPDGDQCYARVDATGVWHIASAYSSTSRSSGANAGLSLLP